MIQREGWSTPMQGTGNWAWRRQEGPETRDRDLGSGQWPSHDWCLIALALKGMDVNSAIAEMFKMQDTRNKEVKLTAQQMLDQEETYFATLKEKKWMFALDDNNPACGRYMHGNARCTCAMRTPYSCSAHLRS